MHIGRDIHLTYCTNIHPGETWDEVFQSLREYVPPLKQLLSPAAPLGIGLRLSDQASRVLAKKEEIQAFCNWLTDNGLYVFTMNGFPYGGFHRQRVKDDVHRPDWTTPERRDYTVRLARILAQLPNQSAEAGISTSPLTYRPWHTTEAALNEAITTGCLHLAETVKELATIASETGVTVHLDIEPEPDGLIDHVADTVGFFNQELIPAVTTYLMDGLRIKAENAEELARQHLRLCYDVCHFAVMYENPAEALRTFDAAGIRIGKLQISAALKADLPADRTAHAKAFGELAESTYLHQVSASEFRIQKRQFGEANSEFRIRQYPDLPDALPHIHDPALAEWRTHFHVPVFVQDYSLLQSTQADIVETLRVLKSPENEPFTRHLEVETYTWEVLPPALKTNLLASIEREMRWVLEQLGTHTKMS
ncbi:MAG: metabolite traffic protein EboE [Cytophagales bacterium]|nr:metabolite traffic protein EboE [Cytophagales bacterium]